MGIDTKTIAWMAGLLEGEGCFTQPSQSRLHYPVIKLSMTDKDIVSRVAKIWNRPLREQPQRGKGMKLMYMVELYGGRAAGWMMSILPFLGERRKKRVLEILTAWKIHSCDRCLRGGSHGYRSYNRA